MKKRAKTIRNAKAEEGKKPRIALNAQMAVALLLLAGFLVLVVADNMQLGMSNPAREKDIIAQKLIQGGDLSLVKVDHTIEKDSIERLSRMDYQDLKSQLGVKSDFTMYFVDGDGNIIPINGRTCIGSPKAKVAGQQCG